MERSQAGHSTRDVGTTFGAIGGQAMECLQLLPKLVPDKDKDYGKDKDKDYGMKLCQKAFVWWSVALQRGNPWCSSTEFIAAS